MSIGERGLLRIVYHLVPRSRVLPRFLRDLRFCRHPERSAGPRAQKGGLVGPLVNQSPRRAQPRSWTAIRRPWRNLSRFSRSLAVDITRALWLRRHYPGGEGSSPRSPMLSGVM
jgi:hypothetical protein